jgi:hypothetical protein
MSEPLTKAALDRAISLMEASQAIALHRAPLGPVFLLPVNQWSYEYMMADRRKARRMRRKRGRAKEASQ